MTIATTYTDKLTVQEYGAKQSIAGVEKIELRLQGDDGGNFMEIARLSEGTVAGTAQPFQVQQLSFSVVLPTAVKAYHIHKNQDDLWFVPPQHRLLINLHDLREDSPTFDLHERVVLGGGKGMLLRIPAGVAHGAKNCYDTPMFLFYATTTQFSLENPDEFRLPWDAFGSDVWDIVKG
ncbi:dTDP-4-dehydrorhamnose 3,5-epimerase family protein [Candidatus Woesebacteria bacterium]|nr:dTDP-4-dehydrorhamnose 3,5-epimerase family protein [Candidatus Woesebacteria bacterium]